MKKVVYLLVATAIFSLAILSGARQTVEAQKEEIREPAVSPNAAMACTPQPSGLIAWYRGEGNGIDTAGSNTATPQNGSGFTLGQVGQGFDFDGVDDIFTAPHTPALAFGTSSFTIETWARADGTNNYSALFTKREEAHPFDGFNFYRGPDGTLGSDIKSGGLVTVSSDSAMPLGQWVHLALVIDRTSNTARMYVNGVLQASQPSLAGIGSLTSTEPLRMGRVVNSVANPNPAQAFDGSLDEFSIYNVALSTTQIQDIYNAGGSGKCTSPAAFSCVTAPANLNSWFPANDSASDIQSGNTNGWLMGNATYTSDAKVGRAFTFDGNGDYLSVPDAPEQKPVDQLTAEGWFKIDSFSAPIPHFIAKPLRNSGDDSYVMWFGSGNIRIGYRQTSGGFLFHDTGFVPQAGVYYHLAYTLDTTDSGPTANTMKLFVDGVQVFSGPAGLPIYYNGINDALVPYPLVIGSDIENNNPDYFLAGKADEVSLYGRALSPAEIQSIYGAESAGKCGISCSPAFAGMVAWYPGEGNALDVRGGNNGSLNNGASFAPGRVGQAFSFDGSDDYISIPKSPVLNFGTGDFSVEFWAKFNNTSLLGGMASGDNFGAAGDYNGWLFNNDFGSGGIGWLTRKASVGTAHARWAASNFSNGTWYHMTGVRTGRTLNFYVNGALVSTGIEASAIDVSNPYELRIGSLSLGGPQNFSGMIDELALYNRALTPTEVASAAGTAKCKPTAVTTFSGQVAWWSGDGNASDISGNGNNGTLQNGASFSIAKAGQGFSFDGVDDHLFAPASASLDVGAGGGFTVEAWVKPASATTEQPLFEWNSGGPANANIGAHFWISVTGLGGTPGNLFGNIFDTGGGSHVVQTPIAVMTSGQFQHVALTYDKTSGLTSIYHNGTLITSANIGSFTPRTSSNFYLGYRPGSVVFNGEMDEPAVYDHALSGSEVRSIFTAGIAGKLKSSSTPAGLFRRVAGRSLAPETVSSTVGDVTVTFQNVTSAGTTQEISMDHSILPPLPSGLPLLTYDVATSASYTGNVDLCFNVPGLAGVPIANLRVYHLESGVWVNRTASGATHSALCTTGVTSLSPFAIANVTPSAANVSISGRVLTPGGRGIVNALVRLTDSHGMTRIVQTGSLGYYSFEGVAAGQNYSLSVSARRYRFGEPVRIVFPGDEITDADFIAME